MNTRSQILAKTRGSVTARRATAVSESSDRTKIQPKKITTRRTTKVTETSARNEVQPKKITTRRTTSVAQSSARSEIHPKKIATRRETSVGEHNQSKIQPKKIAVRRNTTVLQSIVRNEDQPKKLSARRVTFSDENTVHSYSVNKAPNKRGNESVVEVEPIRLTIAEKIRTLTRPVVVCLERLTLIQHAPNTESEGNLPHQAGGNSDHLLKGKLSTQQEETHSGGLLICEDCAPSFDSIFEQKRQAYIHPYDKWLEVEKQANKNAQKQLEEIDQQWNEEAQKHSRLAHELDKAQEKWAKLIQTNFDLKMRFERVSAAVSHDHTYAQQ